MVKKLGILVPAVFMLSAVSCAALSDERPSVSEDEVFDFEEARDRDTHQHYALRSEH